MFFVKECYYRDISIALKSLLYIFSEKINYFYKKNSYGL